MYNFNNEWHCLPINQIAPLEWCHVIPRLLISALENKTCLGMDCVKDVMSLHQFYLQQFSSIQFVQTSPKNLFQKPKSLHHPFMEL